MKCFVDPIPKLGIAMDRTALALKLTAPAGVQIVSSPEEADLQVLHAVGPDVKRHLKAPPYAVMMHALNFMADPAGNGDNIPIPPLQYGAVDEGEHAKASATEMDPWTDVWRGAEMVWSYYPLHERFFKWGGLASLRSDGVVESSPELNAPVFYGAPLGADANLFKKSMLTREHICLTTGYVSGPRAEAIEEVALAAGQLGLSVRHLGPSNVGGMNARVPGWQAVTGLSEDDLVTLYGSVKYVSGLRHGEGFELPVIEGLLCGARPICFDLPCYRLWFDKHAIFVPECSGDALVKELVEIFRRPPRPILPEERRLIAMKFDWAAIGKGFWSTLLKLKASSKPDALSPSLYASTKAADDYKVKPDYAIRDQAMAMVERRVNQAAYPAKLAPETRPRLLWVGDSPTTPWTGFGKATTYILAELSKQFEVMCVGTTHDGAPYDRTKIPYDVYPLNYGIGKVVTQRKPHLAIIQHDPWQIPQFVKAIGHTVPIIGVMPIDGKNCNCSYLNGLALAVWWTKFAEREASENGYGGASAIIPLGVDQSIYYPMDKIKARRATGFSADMDDAWIVGYIARNQPRKRLDLAVRHFSEWIKTKDVQNAYLYIQTAPTGETAYDVSELIRYERVSNRFIPVESDLRGAVPEERMRTIYNSIDVFWSTSQGEGFGLPALEAMACGTPCVLPNWAAYGDWAQPAARLVQIAETAATINFAKPLSGVKIAVLGATPDRRDNVAALDQLYRDPEYYRDRREAGLALTADPRYRWATIGAQFIEAATAVLDGPVVLTR